MVLKKKIKDNRTWWDRFDSSLLKKILRIKNNQKPSVWDLK